MKDKNSILSQTVMLMPIVATADTKNKIKICGVFRTHILGLTN